MKLQFGEALRDWRGKRRMSQMDLALTAGVSARHVAFLEKGRSSPSRAMVEQLIAALDVPHRDRNELLVTAGFAPLYSKLPVDDPRLATLRAGLSRLLRRHAPWPGLLLDGDWNIIEANATAEMMLAVLASDPSEPNLLRRLANAARVSEVIANWPEVAEEFISRLKAEALKSADAAMLEKVAEFADLLPGAAKRRAPEHDVDPLFTVKLRLPDGTQLALCTVLGQFSAARDITAAELRLELFFPADQSTSALLERLGQDRLHHHTGDVGE